MLFLVGSEDEGQVLPVPDIPFLIQKSIVVSHDNASNITKALNDCSIQSVRCFAHTINLAVQKFVKSIGTHLAAMRNVVKYIQKSPAATKLIQVLH